jgi:pimeloyl-ACP methyl ester carboxylesterase
LSERNISADVVMKSRPSPAAAPLFVAACALLILTPYATSAAPDVQTLNHRLHIEGDRGPVVILEGGLGDTLDTWAAVQSAIASHCGRTVAYNRAGYPGSNAAQGSRDAATIVSELRDELHRQGIAPPYVLVGHSLGGLYMQYFARQYADEVAGLVLVDSTHWNQQLLLGASTQNEFNRRGTVMLFMSFIARRELNDSARAGEQVHDSPRAAGVPTVVLSSTGAPRGETPASRTEGARLQEDIVADFPGARHVRVEGSGHYIQKDRPDVVIEAVRELAGCARSAS